MVAERYLDEIVRLRHWLDVGLRVPLRKPPGRQGVSGLPAIGDSAVLVSVSVSFDSVADRGSFEHPDVRQLSLFINSRIAPEPGESVWTPMPAHEADGWARAAFGDAWSDYIYQVHVARNELGRWPLLYVVFVEPDGNPVLATDDYQWDEAGIGAIARPRKLAPRKSNRKLRQFLISKGDVTGHWPAATAREPDL